MKKTQTSSGSRNSSRKATNNEQADRKTNLINPAKQQNIKQFKMEIDHEIAKCLDTLDRQGLKYLRQTLKNSNIFNEEIKEAVIVEKNKEKPKNISKSPAKNKNSDHIQQQIVQQLQTFLDDKDQPAKQRTRLGPNTSRPLKQQKVIPVKLQKFQDKIQQPLKPFTKRNNSRQGSRANNQQQKAVCLQKLESVTIQKEQKIKDKSQIDMIIEKISQLPQHKLRQLGKIIDRLQRSQKIQSQQIASFKQTRPYMLKPDQSIPNQSNMRNSAKKDKKNQKATSLYNSIMKGNKKVGYSKQKQKGTQSKQQSPGYEEHNDEQIDQNQISEQISEIQIQNQINQPKALDIPDQIKRYEFNTKQKQINQAQPKQQASKNQQKLTESNMGKKSGSQLIMKKGSFVKNFPISNIKKPLDIQVTQSHQADTLQMNSGGNQSKMVRLGKKKLGTNKVKVVLLRNRGHPSIIGLTCMQFYNTNAKLIPITIQNIKSQSSPKLLRLFNGVYNTTNEQQMFTTTFKRDFQIQLQIPQKIGGIKIWNYNKSQIQSSKQTDWIQLYINDKLAWQGLIKKGSYNQITDYSTVAQIQQGFSFDKIKKQPENQIKINQQNESSLKLDTLRTSQAFSIGGTYIKKNKQKQKDSNKVDWLQKTLMQEKIKQIQQEDKKLQTNQFRKTGTKVNRFSQLYNEQDNYASNLGNNLKNFKQTKKQGKQKPLQNILGKEKNSELSLSKKMQKTNSNLNFNQIQRTARTNSQKIEQQKDIFSNFGQSLLKQKIKANQINAKVNQINEQVQKFKQTMKKQSDFGYSSLITKQEINQPKFNKTENKQMKQQKQKKPLQKQSLDDFMNDSLFKDQPVKQQKNTSKPAQRQFSVSPQLDFSKKPSQQKHRNVKPYTNNKADIDDILNQLNDLVGSKQNRYQFGNQKQKQIVIPQLPKGSKLQIAFMSNWGDPTTIGINKIQFFDCQGQRVFPSQAKSNIQSQPITSIFSQNKGYLNEQSDQWKCAKKQQIRLNLTFSKKIQFAFMRFWNFVGDRVHSMIGVRKIQILLQGSLIFVGDVRKNAGTSRDQIFKSCQSILFTNNVIIQKRIIQNDWLTKEIQSSKQQTVIFRKTIQNFNRPLTNGLINEKQIKVGQNKQGFKLPKRNCFEYDPPNFPSGYYVKLILHTTWGDRDFIGLNGIVLLNEKAEQITTQIKKISQFPAPLVTLSGYQKDKRILSNLLNGKNLTSNDQSIWLAPYLRDVDKMEKQAQNAILIQFEKACTISAINIYNYAKTPNRGVRQIEIYIDNYLVYRGYLRIANLEAGQILTTINFTKDPALLEKIGYIGYNQDNLGQQVNFYNQGKPQKPMF